MEGSLCVYSPPARFQRNHSRQSRAERMVRIARSPRLMLRACMKSTTNFRFTAGQVLLRLNPRVFVTFVAL